MNSIKQNLAVIICCSLIANPVIAQSNKSSEVQEVQNELIEKCMDASECDLFEMTSYVESLDVVGENASILKSVNPNTGSLETMIKSVRNAGVSVLKVTLKTGGKVVNVAADSLDYISDLKPVRALIKGGEKVVTFTIKGLYNGVEKTVVFTLNTTKAVLSLKPVKVVVTTSLKAVKHITIGTYNVIKAVVTSKPIVVVGSGVEAVLKLNIVKKTLSTTSKVVNFALETTLDTATVLVKGTWKAGKYAKNGALIVIGAPYVALKSIWRSIRR